MHVSEVLHDNINVCCAATRNYTRLAPKTVPRLDFGTGKNVNVINIGHSIQVHQLHLAPSATCQMIAHGAVMSAQMPECLPCLALMASSCLPFNLPAIALRQICVICVDLYAGPMGQAQPSNASVSLGVDCLPVCVAHLFTLEQCDAFQLLPLYEQDVVWPAAPRPLQLRSTLRAGP